MQNKETSLANSAEMNSVTENESPWQKMAREVNESSKDEKNEAKISEVEDGVFKIEGILTEENIAEINERRSNATYIIENTAGLTSDMLKKIKPEGVLFSVKGGLDYENISKYDKDKYKERTMMSLKGLEKAVKYFEHIESEIDPEWSEAQKAMYCYGCLADDFSYCYETEADPDPDEIMKPGQAIRGLNGILYGKFSCAGFAFVYQEMMNRQGIKCHYANQINDHAYNVLEIDDKFYGIDVTWDNNHKTDGERCGFREFGRDEHFYEREGHLNYKEIDISEDFETIDIQRVYDEDEPRYPLSIFSLEELRENYKVISERLERRHVGAYTGFENQPKETREKFLPVEDIVGKRLAREANQEEVKYGSMFKKLRKDGNLRIDQRLIDAIEARRNYIDDISDNGSYDKKDMENIYGADNLKYYDSYKEMSIGKRVYGDYLPPANITEDSLIDDLNQELSNQIMQEIVSTYNSVDSIIENYDCDSKNPDFKRFYEEVGSHCTKLMMVLRAKELLVENGIPEAEVEAKCAMIKSKFESINDSSEKHEVSARENGIDFLGGVFADKAEIRKHIESIEGRSVDDEEFRQKSTDANYLLNKVYTNLDLDEYSITIDDFQKILNGEL